MKKRALEAAAILLAMVAVFVIFNLLSGGIADSNICIDGQYYHISARELDLALITEDGTDRLKEFDRLESLSIIPYKRAIILQSDEYNSAGSDEERAAVMKVLATQADRHYADATMLSDLSFLEGVRTKSLDIRWCSVNDLSPLLAMNGLKKLNISHTYVTDLSVLEGLDGLEELIAEGIPAEDLSPLTRINGLKTVTVSRDTDQEQVDLLGNAGIEVRFPEEKKKNSILPDM